LLEELNALCKRYGISAAEIKNTAKGPTKEKVALARKVGQIHYELNQKSTLYSPVFQAEAFGVSAGLIRSRIHQYLNSNL